MGTWGENLYDDDDACDVRDSLAVLSKLPADGDRILDILLETTSSNTDLDDDRGPTFWLAVADQFEKRGVACPKAFDLAIRAIESGADLRDQEARGADQRGLIKRKKVLDALLVRLKSPRPTKEAKRTTTAPPASLLAGQVYAFPTMNGEGMNAWFTSWDQAGFQPNGWGALIVVAHGRLYDWFPWAAYTSVNVNPVSEPRLADVLSSKTLLKDGVAYCLPNRSHMKRMGMKLLGRVPINHEAAQSLIQRQPFQDEKRAVSAGWSICSGAKSTTDSSLGTVYVSSLVGTSNN